MLSINAEYMAIEDEVKKSKTSSTNGWKRIGEMMQRVTQAFQEVCVRHTGKSMWFDDPIKDPIDHEDIDRDIHFPPVFMPLLDIFDQTLRNQLQATKTKKVIEVNETIEIIEVNEFKNANLFTTVASVVTFFPHVASLLSHSVVTR